MNGARLIPSGKAVEARESLAVLFAEAGLVEEHAAAAERRTVWYDTAGGRLARAGARLFRDGDPGVWTLTRKGRVVARRAADRTPEAPCSGRLGRHLAKLAGERGLVAVLEVRIRERRLTGGAGGGPELLLEEHTYRDPHTDREVPGPIRISFPGQEAAHREVRDFVLTRLPGGVEGELDLPAAGLAALGLPVPGAPPDPEWRVRPGDPVERAVGRVLRRQCAMVRAHRRGAVLDLDPEFLHQARVAVRRMRSALRIFGGRLDPARTAAVARELSGLGRTLGRARDLDVLLERLGRELVRVEAPPEAAARIRAAFEARRGAAHQDAARALASRDLDRLLEAVERLGEAMPGADSPAIDAPAIDALAGPLVKQAAGKLRRELRRPVEALSAGDLHRVRIRLKRLRYLGEFLGDVEPPAFGKAVRRLVPWQDRLGEFQDARMARAAFRALAEVRCADPRPSADELLVLGALSERARHRRDERRRRVAREWKRLPGRVARVARTLAPAEGRPGKGGGS